VDFVDTTLVRLADSATRGQVIDDAALSSLIDATYEPGSMDVAAPFGALFDAFELGVDLPMPTLATGAWLPRGGAERIEARFEITGLPRASLRVDALWTGSVTATVNFPSAVIESLDTAWADVGNIDAQIVSDLGGLPGDPQVLEHERRERYLEQLRAVAADPGALTEEALERDLADAGVRSIADLMERAGGGIGAVGAKLRMRVTTPPAATVRQLPVRTALLVRDDAALLADLLRDSKQLSALMRGSGQVPAGGDFPSRGKPTVMWVLPRTLFDDVGWPGPDNATRRRRAAEWLAREGIALAAVA